MLLQCLTGSENWKNHSAKLHVFYSPTEPGLREVHIGVAAKDDYTQVHQVSALRSEAKPGFRSECGFWTRGVYEVAPDMVFKIFAYRSGNFGSRRLSANQFIAMREDAALRRVTLQLSRNEDARYAQATVQGRFDLITFRQAQLLGAKVLPQFQVFSEPSVLRQSFVFEILEPERAPRPQLETTSVLVDNRAVPVVTRQRRRMMPT